MLSARGRASILVVVSLLLVTTLTACGSGRATTGERTLTVLAAASLTETFRELASAFEGQHDDVTVRLTFDSSAALSQQALEGAPADVLATADTATMDQVEDGGATVGDPVPFARNTLVLVAPARSTLAGLDDLTGSRWVMCVPTAPCGRAAADLLEANGVTSEPVSLEVDVKAVLAKVVADEADAGLVFATDAQTAQEQVRTLPVPGADSHATTYHAAVLQQSAHRDLARRWVDLLTSAEGGRILSEAGFGRAG
ncbi:molybdate ABC transporter substrate-binding protein [Nocardioides sp.]|uniref:molybdate ABC transporter substrate-binding protein n=1 Tax=Nocardioides sp. TaxID=35761 RepID=UPI002736F96C|nr:molybdate ABC transporter substrate-binding protein [Nocardioides sp.]MDP3890552.1 molybdate ABC transporter substrate-binding protein [Nocardioides sp.]